MPSSDLSRKTPSETPSNPFPSCLPLPNSLGFAGIGLQMSVGGLQMTDLETPWPQLRTLIKPQLQEARPPVIFLLPFPHPPRMWGLTRRVLWGVTKRSAAITRVLASVA